MYVLDEKGAVKNIEVQIMEIPRGNYYVVTKGLKAGDKIVLEGFQSLKDGVQIKQEVKSTDSVFADLKNN